MTTEQFLTMILLNGSCITVLIVILLCLLMISLSVRSGRPSGRGTPTSKPLGLPVSKESYGAMLAQSLKPELEAHERYHKKMEALAASIVTEEDRFKKLGESANLPRLRDWGVIDSDAIDISSLPRGRDLPRLTDEGVIDGEARDVPSLPEKRRPLLGDGRKK